MKKLFLSILMASLLLFGGEALSQPVTGRLSFEDGGAVIAYPWKVIHNCTQTVNADGTITLDCTAAGAGDITSVLDGAGPTIPILHQAATAFTSADATPTVAGHSVFITANAAPTTITDFDDPTSGQIIWVIVNDANTTFDFTSSGLEGSSADYVAASGDLVNCVYSAVDSQWHCVITGGVGPLGATIESAEITNATIVAADISATAAIALTQLEALADGKIIVGSALNVPTAVTMSGDVTIDNLGATTIGANKVALATDTTGNYVATIADAGSATITVTGSGAENATITLDVAAGGLTAAHFKVTQDWGDISIDGAGAAQIDSGVVTTTEILDDTISATDLNAVLTFANGDLIDLSGIIYVNASTADEGLALPGYIAGAAPASGKNFLAYDAVNNVLMVYEAGGWVNASVGAGAAATLNFVTTQAEGTLTTESILDATSGGVGITVVDAGGDGGQITIIFDPTEVTGDRTWSDGTGAAIVWTWNLTAGDPTITFGNGLITLSQMTSTSVNIDGGAIDGTTVGSGTPAAGAFTTLTASSTLVVTGSLTANGGIIMGTGDNLTVNSVALLSGDELDGTKIKDADYGDVTISAGGDWAVEDDSHAHTSTTIPLASTDLSDTAAIAYLAGAQTFTANNVFGNADTDTLSIQSIIRGVGRAVTIDDDATSAPTYATGTNALFVEGIIETPAAIYAASFNAYPSADPAVILNEVTAGDTDYWFGINADQEGDDDDYFAIGKGLVPGTTTLVQIDTSGNVVATGSLKGTGLIFEGGTFDTTIGPGTPTSSVSYTWPAGPPAANGYALVSSTAGVLTFAEITATAAGAEGNLQYSVTGVLGAEAALSYNATNNTLSITQAAANPTLQVGDGTYSWNHTPQVGIEGVLEVDLNAFFNGGLVLGSDGTVTTAGEIGYASNVFTLFANSENLTLTAGTNLWTFASATDATFAFTPAVTFTAGLTGALTGNADTATLAATSTIVDSTDATSFIVMVDSATGSLALKTDTGLTYAADTGILTATGFAGPLTGNVTGNASGTAATVTGAAQVAITSLGTLTALTVDNIGIDLNTISSSSGNINITPVAGSNITLDGTIVIDAGVVTGATSITSTAFVGNLTGNVTGPTADDPYISFQETDGTNWWLGVDDVGNSIEFRTSVTVGTDVKLELEEDGDIVVTGDATLTGGDLTLAAAGVKLTGANGALTILGLGDGQDEDVKIDLNTTANTITVSSPASSATTVSLSALNLVTTGNIQAGVKISSDIDGMDAAAMTAVGLYGTMFFATGAGTWALPSAAEGMSFCVYSTTAAAIVINPDDADDITLNGTLLADGDSITSASGAGDFICLVAIDATHWYTLGRSGTWTDTN